MLFLCGYSDFYTKKMDFTLKQYKLLLNALVAQGYTFQSFVSSIKLANPEVWGLSLRSRSQEPIVNSPFVILRHDVEANYERALQFAEIQHALGIQGTYYFRILPKSFKPEIVKKIADLGHEIGYHYDDLAVCKGDYEKAIARFQKNLKTLREIAPVETICMDGSPLSRFDNKAIWRLGDMETERLGDKETERLGDREKGSDTSASSRLRSMSALSVKGAKGSTNQTYYAYQDFGIIGEPYFDIDFDKVFYLTDTGRRWDGWKTSVRDKVPQQEEWVKQGLVFHSTQDIINAIEGKGKGHGDKGTWRQGDLETRGLGDKGTWRQRDLETRGLGDKGTWRQGDLETRGLGDKGTRGKSKV